VDVLGLAVAAHRVRPTVFQRAEDGGETGGDAVFAGDLADNGFLVELTVGQIAEGAVGLFGVGVGGGFEARGKPLGKCFEVFDQHVQALR
jgi:hypothetical protein